ncbi:sensor histidine kinase [Merdimonas faecis]|uniref:histidine kinase n=1 Tax=Merdimonas faecis TaxID=1653435 RepID=A0A9D2VZJ8_9FIRM|nr:HAMP domain-containing sensor histidine kinase [Merdimonas faecis]HJH50618.1 HAMP domain-containing histidine kinase [Merdimonas faecis]
MDTKLKNRHKLAVVLIILTLLMATANITSYYSLYENQMKEEQENSRQAMLRSEDFLRQFVQASWVIYLEEDRDVSWGEEGTGYAGMSLEDVIPSTLQEYDEFYPYLEYVMADGDGDVISQSMAPTGEDLTEGDFSNYTIALNLSYDGNGEADIRVRKGPDRAEIAREFRRVLNGLEAGDYWGEMPSEYDIPMPANREFTFAMTEGNLWTYLEEHFYYEDGLLPGDGQTHIFGLSLLVAAAALLYPLVKSFNTGDEKVFRAPLEVVCIAAVLVITAVCVNAGWMIRRSDGVAGPLDLAVWFLYFAVVYWAAGNLRRIFVLGPILYFKEYSLLVSQKCGIRKGVKEAWETMGRWRKRAMDTLLDLKLSDVNNRMILKVVGLNFVILAVITCFWYYGLILLVIYSAVLFYFLRGYFRDIREKYDRLNMAAAAIANGDLKTEIPADTGLFEPVAESLQKIQEGFGKAVEEEVKSQRMKTELITNVSHDLKTPLTAIITYVDLLKKEEDPGKQKEYVEVLEKKSQRLKVLIEDLFEISKAGSGNVKLELMDVDVVNLFKQVKLELEDKIKKADLDFRCSYPEEKLTVRLDSQKTYRIFENLLVNIVKYAMPHTRVFIEILREDDQAVIRMKNISEQELNIQGQELTERFVRGDASRNTEGAGLGLAIVKSFVELQGGEFGIEIDGDLFKTQVRFRDLC